MPREERGLKCVENEKHVLFECDLYADLRAKLIQNLKKVPPIHNHVLHDQNLSMDINNHSLKHNFMDLISQYTSFSTDDSQLNFFNFHHATLNKNRNKVSPETDLLLERRRYMVNCACTYIYHTLEKHKKYKNSLRNDNFLKNMITINF